jgi:hypothetical protein
MIDIQMFEDNQYKIDKIFIKEEKNDSNFYQITKSE